MVGKAAQLSPKVRGQIEAILSEVYGDQLVVPVGKTLRCSVNWTNIGIPGARDLAVQYGTYDPATETFTPAFSWVVTGVYLESGASVVTDIDGMPTEANAGTWDAIAMVGIYDSITDEFIYDDYRVLEKVVIVGVSAKFSVEMGSEYLPGTQQTIDIWAKITNVGGSLANDVWVTLYCDPPGAMPIVTGSNPQYLGTISPGKWKKAWWTMSLTTPGPATLAAVVTGIDSLTGAEITVGTPTGEPVGATSFGAVTEIGFAVA